jgi:hypothetical protein
MLFKLFVTYKNHIDNGGDEDRCEEKTIKELIRAECIDEATEKARERIIFLCGGDSGFGGLENLTSGELVQIIKTFIPKTTISTTLIVN